MKLKNRIYNFIHRVKLLDREGCFNCGRQGDSIVRYDWSIKKLIFTTKKYYIVRSPIVSSSDRVRSWTKEELEEERKMKPFGVQK